jgi:lipopolysaccharide export system permease protein
MIRLLDRYVVRQFMGTFLGLVLGLPLLFVITDLTDHLDKHLAAGLSAGTVALSYVYQLPLFVFYAFPIAALVATVFTIGNMTRHQEIAAAKAGGVSFYRLMLPIVALAVLLSGVAVVLSEVVPVSNQRRAELLQRQPRHGLTSLRTNFVYQTEEGRMLSARRLDAERNQLFNVVIERRSDEAHPGTHEAAEGARWTPESGWTLERGFLRVLTNENTERTFAFDEMRVPLLRETPTELLAQPKDVDQMRYAEVAKLIRTVERSGGDIRPLQVEREQKLALPMAVLVIVLFGAPLATSSKRGGAAYGIGISLAITIIYLLLFRVGKAIGSSGAMDPVLAAWFPNLLFLLAGLVLLARVRT